MSESKYKPGAIIISKCTNNTFIIEPENESGDKICSIILTPTNYALAISGKQVKADITIDGVVFENGNEGALAISKSTDHIFYLEVTLPNNRELCQCVLTPEELAFAISGTHTNISVREYVTSLD